MIRCLFPYDPWPTSAPRFIFQSQGEPKSPGEGEAAKGPEAPAEKADPLATDPEQYFEDQSNQITTVIERFKGISPEAARAMTAEAEGRINGLKQKYLAEKTRLAAEKHPELMRDARDAAQHFLERVQAKLQVQKAIAEKPELRAIYDQLKDRTWKAEELLLSIDEILEKENDPEVAMRKVMGAMMRREAFGWLPKEPAKPNELITEKNRLNVEQMEAVYEMIGVDFDRLEFSADQMAKMEIIGEVTRAWRSKLEGMTYMEAGLLDANGRIVPEGWQRLFAYRAPDHNADEVRDKMADYEASFLRKGFTRAVPFFRTLQAHTEARYGEKGALPTLTFADRAFDLNEIAEDQERETSRFAEALKYPAEGTPDTKEKAEALPKTLQTLFEYRFDENTGVLDSLRWREMPEPVRGHLESLGMAKPSIEDDFQGKIRGLSFEYQGVPMEITIGKKWRGGSDQQPHLRVNYKNQLISDTTVDLRNIGQALQDAQQFYTDNEKNAERLLHDFFPEENPDLPPLYGGIANEAVRYLKEDYLGTLRPPQANDLRGVTPERIARINKVLPIILANQEALGIRDDMTVFEAMMRIYSAPNAEALLHQDYSLVLAELKNASSAYYTNVRPNHFWKEPAVDRNDMIDRSRNSNDPELAARKEQLAKLKPGDKLAVSFEGKAYSFVLADSFQNHHYRFKLEGYPKTSDFEINVVDLTERTPEEQLQYLMGNSFRQFERETEELLRALEMVPQQRRTLSLQREYSRGKLTPTLLRRLPFDEQQIAFLTQFNATQPLELGLTTNNYGNITSVRIEWRNEAEKIDYYLDSADGDYWRLHSLADTSSKRTFLGYDIRTSELGGKIKRLASHPQS